MKKNNEKNVLVLSAIAVITLIVVVVGATFAYFQAQGGTSSNTNVNVQTATTDNLSFQIGNAINITANQENFAPGLGNQSGSTTASATLTANNATNNATRNYYVYLRINTNEFIYTTEDNEAELLLKVTGPEGEATTISGLDRKTSGNETGFDITTSTGLITIADNYEITASPNKTDEWQVEVIFANLDSDQNANTGKSFSANLIIQEDVIPTTVADICKSGDNLANCIAEFNTLAGDGADNIYYHDGQGTYGAQEAGDNSYRYSGANPNNYVCFGTTGETCQNEENQYRIIGVFNNQEKLIKATSYGSYAWDADSNTWDATTKPDIYYTLNETYYNSLNSEWQNLIAESTWQVGGFNGADLGTAKETYDIEVGIGQSGYKETMKIGLMYVSDYGYGMDPEKWTVLLDTDYVAMGNWLFSNDFAWFISRMADSPDGVFWEWYYSMFVSVYSVDRNTTAIRPTFYLEPTVTISGGTGTSSDPFILTTN